MFRWRSSQLFELPPEHVGSNKLQIFFFSRSNKPPPLSWGAVVWLVCGALLSGWDSRLVGQWVAWPPRLGSPPHTHHTYKDDDEGTSTHPSPPTPVPPSSFLYPPLPLAVKVRGGMPFSFCRFFTCVMCVSFVAYNKYEEYLKRPQVC